MNKKRIGALLAALLLGSTAITGCSSNGSTGNTGAQTETSQSTQESSTEEETLHIVTTIFPEYDWVRQIMGEEADNVELTLLLDNGTDLHSFQPTVQDMMEISSADLFIYVGGESDDWVEDALEEAVNEDMRVINLMEVLGDVVREEVIVEGMQDDEHDHDHSESEDDHDDHDDHDEEEEHEDHDEEETEYDEHVWLSLRNASAICDAIRDELVLLDEEHRDVYDANFEAYNEVLSVLDEQYQTVIDEAQNNTLLFADRFPFRYLTDDYNIDYYAAFSGCSAETEASFETVTFLSDKVDELNLSYVLTLEKSDAGLAETIISNTQSKDQTVTYLDSMQAVTRDEIEEGVTYQSVMEQNLETLKTVLS